MTKHSFLTACAAAALLVSFAAPAALAQDNSLRQQARDAFQAQQPEQALKLIEQFIIANPADLSARFFRANILASIGRGGEVVDELKLMTTLNLPAADKQRAEQLIFAIERKGRKLTLGADMDLGFGSTDNANSWPNGGKYTTDNGLEIELPDPVYDQFSSQSDTFYDVSLGLKGSYALAQNGKTKAVFGLGLTEKAGSDTKNMDSSLTKMNVGLESPLPGGFEARIGFATSENDRVNSVKKKTSNEMTDLNSDQDKTTLDYSISKKFGSLNAGVRMSSTETDASETGSADQYDATADTTSFFVGSPLGSRSYVRLAINSTEQSSDATGNDKADGEKKTTKDSDGFSLLYVRVFSSTQRLILSYTSSESEFAKQEIDGKKRLDELGYLSAKYTLNGEAVTPRLQDYKLNFDVSMLDSTSNQKSANVESTTYKFSISRKFDLY